MEATTATRGPVRVVLISTYELGRQPFGLASPAAWLRKEGAEVTLLDLSVEELDQAAVRKADLVGFHVPMHTATRLAERVMPLVRRLNSRAHICVFGLYASMNDDHLRGIGADSIIGGEFENDLVEVFRKVRAGHRGSIPTRVPMGRLAFVTPDRHGLPPLSRYGHLVLATGEPRTAGYTEASRGCRHRCRHCPLAPVYNGRFRVVPAQVVLDDVRQQVAAGAEHITFGDPDFFNGPAHSLRVVRELHDTMPELTYDVTIKVEHLRRHRHLLPALRDTGCILVTSAVESFDDVVLHRLDKGHTLADVEAVVRDLRSLGLAFNPTFVSFLPWTTLDGYRGLLETVARLDLVEQVSPIQYAIRLLLPAGSLLLEQPDVAALVGEFDREALCYPWTHPDPAVDELCEVVRGIVSDDHAPAKTRAEIANEIWHATLDRRGCCDSSGRSPFDTVQPTAGIPYMSEPWYCCAEPTEQHVTAVTTASASTDREPTGGHHLGRS